MSSFLDKIKVALGFFGSFSNDLNGKTVLAIDDDPAQRKMIEHTLHKVGINVLTANSGQEGLALAFSHHPDLILLDVVMPGMNGNEVCQNLKDSPETKDIPLAFLSTKDDPVEVVKHFEMGAEIHLTKPINARELINQVKHLLTEGK